MADKWWVCVQCKSLNDLPAKKCYKCRSPKPSGAQVVNPVADLTGGRPQRVGVSVRMSDVAQLTTPDPTEHQAGGGAVFEVYAAQPEGTTERRSGTDPSEPSVLRPLRDPPQRGIDALGGIHWEEGLADAPRPARGGGPGSANPVSGGRPPQPPPGVSRATGAGVPPPGAPNYPWPPGAPPPPGALPPMPPRAAPPSSGLPAPMPPGMPPPLPPGSVAGGPPPPGWPVSPPPGVPGSAPPRDDGDPG